MIASKLSGPRGILLAAAMSLVACASAQAQSNELGKKVFTTEANPPCGVCHTLKSAGTTGDVGPNLDELKPSESQVAEAVKSGTGPMPSFAESLSAEQITAVAKFVASTAK